jgi:hypothetical protein
MNSGKPRLCNQKCKHRRERELAGNAHHKAEKGSEEQVNHGDPDEAQPHGVLQSVKGHEARLTSAACPER